MLYKSSIASAYMFYNAQHSVLVYLFGAVRLLTEEFLYISLTLLCGSAL